MLKLKNYQMKLLKLKKLNFIEIIIKAFLSRNVINHFLKNIMIKYKDCVIVEKNNKNELIKINAMKDINKVSVKDSNDLINSFSKKKDYCNNFVHFEGIKNPEFIKNIWGVMLNFIRLNEKEKENFNKIITNDIQDVFEFSKKDKLVNIENIFNSINIRQLFLYY